jgi:hypothetical protein
VLGHAINRPGVSGASDLAKDVLNGSVNLRNAAGQLLEVILTANVASVPCPQLSMRWMNALHWYGAGCTNQADFAALVDFAIALDIISGGLVESGILELTARLLKISITKQVLDDGTTLKKLVDNTYGYRNHIAHGSDLALEERYGVERSHSEALTANVLTEYALALSKYAVPGAADDRDDFRRSLPQAPA